MHHRSGGSLGICRSLLLLGALKIEKSSVLNLQCDETLSRQAPNPNIAVQTAERALSILNTTSLVCMVHLSAHTALHHDMRRNVPPGLPPVCKSLF